jgi:hypothetical protein
MVAHVVNHTAFEGDIGDLQPQVMTVSDVVSTATSKLNSLKGRSALNRVHN